MDEVKHWWNITKYLTNLDGEGANYCRMYYVQQCKQLSTALELPNQNFGPSVMCSYCGALWSKNELQIRILPGKTPSKSVKRIIKSCSIHNSLSRFHATLMKKSMKRKMNKIVMKCSICSKSTQIDCNKPKRLKPIKDNDGEIVMSSKKKKKKKSRDKTAGLNLSNVKSPGLNTQKETVSSENTPIIVKVKTPKGKQVKPIQKVRKINLSKLNDVLKDNKGTKSKNNLNNFLKELY